MSTRAQFRWAVRRLVDDTPPMDTLSGAIDSDDTTLVLGLGLYAGAPQILQIGTELLFCPVYASATKTFTSVVRGFAGTTAASHSSGDAILVSPRFSDQDINDALNKAIRRMNSLGLFQVKTISATFDPATDGYDLASDVIDVYEVRFDTGADDKSWPEQRSFRVAHDMPTSDFPSGVGLISENWGVASGEPIQVRYEARYATFTNDTEDSASDLGLQDFVDDLPPLGAAAELLAFGEVHRTQLKAAVEAIRAQEVPANHLNNTARILDAQFRQRVEEGRQQLRRQYPLRVVYQG